jgi:hypothetical protein
MRPYDSLKAGAKGFKDKVVKIGHRFFGSTHASPTKKRIVRNGRKRARQEARRTNHEQ